MKRYLITFLLLFFAMSVGFSEANLFSLIDLNDFINIEKLESFSDSYFFQDFEKNSKKSICKVCVKIKRPDKKETHICYYNSKGLLEKEESRVYEDYDYVYKYDENDRLLSCGNFTFKYLDDFQRERYCRGVLQYKEIVDFQKEKIIITVISYSKRDADNAIIESGKRVYEYNFENGYLDNICCTSFNIKGIEKKKKNYLFLTYENEKIKISKEYYGEELRCEQSFEYKDNKLIKRTVTYPTDSVANYTVEYSDFDRYGNFQNYVQKSTSGIIKVSFSRIMDYK